MCSAISTKGQAGRRPRTAGVGSDTRGAILAAARSVFARRGFEGASTREVAGVARVNNAMIYYHFHDKRELYRAVLTQAFSEFDKIWDHPVFLSRATSRRKIQAYIEGFIRFQQANEDIRRIMSMEFASGRNNERWIAETLFSCSYQRLAQLIRDAVRKGDLKKVDPSAAIPCLVGMIVHSFIIRPIAQHIVGKNLDLSAKRFGRFVAGLFFDGMAPRSESTR